VNVGAGTGAYEPADRDALAVGLSSVCFNTLAALADERSAKKTAHRLALSANVP
jgi:hypothetical protein